MYTVVLHWEEKYGENFSPGFYSFTRSRTISGEQKFAKGYSFLLSLLNCDLFCIGDSGQAIFFISFLCEKGLE
jgi:hypothetical protein